MTRATLLTKYDSAGGQVVATSVRLGGDDLHLRASCSDRTFVSGSNLTGLTFGIEKPGSFILDFDMHNKVPRFQFTGSGRVAGRDVKVWYNHLPLTRDAVVVEGMLSANTQNKISGKVTFPNPRGQLKLTYVHKGVTSIEPAVEFPSRSWNLGVSHKLKGNHTVKATYDHLIKAVGLAWAKEPESGGACRISANIPVDDPKNVRLLMEKTWNYDF